MLKEEARTDGYVLDLLTPRRWHGLLTLSCNDR